MKSRNVLQKMSKFGGYVFKLSIKDLVRKMMETRLTIGKRKACGFMRKAREAMLSTMCKWGKQTSKGGAPSKMRFFFLELLLQDLAIPML